MVRLGKHFASAALLVVAVTAPAVSQSGTKSATAAPTSTAPKVQAGSATQTSTAAAHPRTHRKKKAEPVAQVPPPPPPTLDQQPPAPPQVSYRDGMLSINAPNSTLSSVLRAVQTQTGATMDVPSSANNDRIAVAIGPGHPRDVLHTLLNGSTFDYMIVGVQGQPGAIQRVILTPKSAGGANANQAVNTPPPAEEPVDDAADTSGESEYPGPPEQQQPMPPGAFRRPMGAPGGQAYQQDQQQQNAFPPGESDNVVKTPEQLMQELQQMQQQQQQYQEQLNPANQNPPQ